MSFAERRCFSTGGSRFRVSRTLPRVYRLRYNYYLKIVSDNRVSEVFHRRELAEQMTQQLLRPQVLQEALRSGLFLSGVRRTGKSTFLKHDLIPALEQAGAIVIYADLWENKDTIAPTGQILKAVRQKLEELKTPLSAALRALGKLVSAHPAGRQGAVGA